MVFVSSDFGFDMLFKRHGCKGDKSWWIDADVVPAGSADRSAEGIHYYRSMRLHKESFHALIQFQVEKLRRHGIGFGVKISKSQRKPKFKNSGCSDKFAYLSEAVRACIYCGELN